MCNVRKVPVVEFKLGSSDLRQTSEAIDSIVGSDDDLLLAAYGYAHAGALNAMHLGQWLKKKPAERRLILLVGVHDTDIAQNPQYGSIVTNFNDLFSHWATNGVPLDRICIYAVQHWHSKLLASMQSLGSFPRASFGGLDPADFEKAFSYDETTALAGQVREALIGSSNATYRALGGTSAANSVRNFEIDVHVLRGSILELGNLSSKVSSILTKAFSMVNTQGSISQIATYQLRALLPSTSNVNPQFQSSTYNLTGL